MNFIKKIVDGKIDDSVHLQFMKFSKGEFRDRAIIKAKFSTGKYIINTSAEFANELVNDLAKKLGSEKTSVTGAIVSTNDLKGELEFKEIKQFQGVKRYLIEKEMSGNEIVKLIQNHPRSFFALSFSVGNDILKIKPKAPKSGKPGKGDEEPKANFCKLITKDSLLGESFIFEKSNFKEANVKHIFLINEIIIPEEFKKEKDFSKIREESKRKGKIIRESEIDGEKSEQIIEFQA